MHSYSSDNGVHRRGEGEKEGLLIKLNYYGEYYLKWKKKTILSFLKKSRTPLTE